MKKIIIALTVLLLAAFQSAAMAQNIVKEKNMADYINQDRLTDYFLKYVKIDTYKKLKS